MAVKGDVVIYLDSLGGLYPALVTSVGNASTVLDLLVFLPSGAQFHSAVAQDAGQTTPGSWAVGPSGSLLSVTAVGSTPSAAGASVSGDALTLQPADATHPGVVTAVAQTFGGVKTANDGFQSSTGFGNNSAGSTQGFSFSGSDTVVRGANVYLQGSGGAAVTSVTANGPVKADNYNFTVGAAFQFSVSGNDLLVSTATAGGMRVQSGQSGAHYGSITSAGMEVDVVGQSFILKSADGTRWKLSVANTTGALTAVLA